MKTKKRKAVVRKFDVAICKSDADRQVVYGEVYAPNSVDTHGDMMLKEDVEVMCHKFLRHRFLSSTVDTEHDNFPNGSFPIESFIAQKNDPRGFTEGAWVLGVKVVDQNLWSRIKSGELSGFSFEGRAKKAKAKVEVTYQPITLGFTAPAADGHTHPYWVKVGANGKVVKGMALPAADGHTHEITRGTATAFTGLGDAKHRHRYNTQPE